MAKPIQLQTITAVITPLIGGTASLSNIIDAKNECREIRKAMRVTKSVVG
jgi:hypothetical protein